MSEKINETIAEKTDQLQGCCTSVKGAAIRNQKMFKKLGIALVAVIILGSIGHAMFTVEGVVTGVSGDTITVTNFWGSSDVAMTEPWKSSTSIQAGDRVRIVTNLQGVIIDVRDGSERGFDRDRHGDSRKGEKDDRTDRDSHDGYNQAAPAPASPAANQ